MPSATSIALLCALAVATIAAVSDHRTGEIPNWITLPPILTAPLGYGLAFGPSHALHCLTATLLSGLAPYLLFKRRAMGGGDVKLFVALGAITGSDLLAGLEIQLGALCLAMIVSLAQLAWKGLLLRTLASTAAMSLNPVLPKPWRRQAGERLLTPIRMGGVVLAATCIYSVPTLALAWRTL